MVDLRLMVRPCRVVASCHKKGGDDRGGFDSVFTCLKIKSKVCAPTAF